MSAIKIEIGHVVFATQGKFKGYCGRVIDIRQGHGGDSGGPVRTYICVQDDDGAQEHIDVRDLVVVGIPSVDHDSGCRCPECDPDRQREQADWQEMPGSKCTAGCGYCGRCS